MKKLHTIFISVSAALFVCVCVLLAILWRGEYCRVTFVCEDGCRHTAWFHKGEVAVPTVVEEAHKAEHEEKDAQYFVFKDQEKLLYNFEEPLQNNRETYYIKTSFHGKWRVQLYHFHTHLGDIMCVLLAEEIYALKNTNTTQGAYLEERFYAAYEALGGSKEDKLKFTIRSPWDLEWNTHEYTYGEDERRWPFSLLYAYVSSSWEPVIGDSTQGRYLVEHIIVTGEPDWDNHTP